MPFASSAGTQYFYFKQLREAGLTHGIFTRLGGVSPVPWGTLNAGFHVGDDHERVVENIRRASRALGRAPDSLRIVRQVHGNDVLILETGDTTGSGPMAVEASPPEKAPAADAVITASSKFTPVMRFADCVPILLYDPAFRLAGIAHAGWRGTLLNVAGRAVSRMTEVFGSNPGDVLAGIGPSICPKHYEVGDEVVSRVEAVFGGGSKQVIRSRNGRPHFDLWSANRLMLAEAGVKDIIISKECTAERPDRWYSHRREAGSTGRFAVMVGLGEGNDSSQ